MVSKPFVCLNDEPSEDDKAGDNEVEECSWVPGEVNFRLPRNKRTERDFPVCPHTGTRVSQCSRPARAQGSPLLTFTLALSTPPFPSPSPLPSPPIFGVHSCYCEVHVGQLSREMSF